MWWPSRVVQVTLSRVLHEKDHGKGMSRNTFFFMAMTCSFCYYVFHGYLFSTLTSVSWVCWIWPHSVTAQQIGSGMNGLGLGAFGFDWSSIADFLFSPLISPFFAIMNVMVGYVFVVYFAFPLAYWGTNMYNAKAFPIFSSDLFTAQGQNYNISQIVNNKFELDLAAYNQNGQIHMRLYFALTYGFGFATIAFTITHVALFYGKEIWQRAVASKNNRPDITSHNGGSTLSCLGLLLLPLHSTRYIGVVLLNVTMWSCYVSSLKALTSLQATVVNFATNFLVSGLTGLFLFKESLNFQWFVGAFLIVLGTLILSKSSTTPEHTLHAARSKLE